MAKAHDIVIVGGGVIGCAIAYRLAKEGADVLVLERDQVGSGASQAAAGMLAPLSDSLGHAALVDLGVESFGLYPSFIAEIEADGGLSVECMESGILRIAFTDEDEDGMKALGSLAAERGLEVSWLGPKQALSLEPQLSSQIRGASYSPNEPQLNPSQLVETIRRAAVARGATFREQTPVTGPQGRLFWLPAPGVPMRWSGWEPLCPSRRCAGRSRM
jgi:glycine oxidase